MSSSVLVTVVDDDQSVRESLPDLLRALGFSSRAFASAEEFLASDILDATKCIVLDVGMPGMSGPDLHRELARQERIIPTIFITAQGSEAVRQRLMNLGAVACLFKPFERRALMDALGAALPGS
jgi:FixJ family two-component response regulator